MSEYLKIAESLERSSDENSLDMEKIASLVLLYEYEKNRGTLLNKDLLKTAEKVYNEKKAADDAGVYMVINALMEELSK